jgi:hypothetical protein
MQTRRQLVKKKDDEYRRLFEFMVEMEDSRRAELFTFLEDSIERLSGKTTQEEEDAE